MVETEHEEFNSEAQDNTEDSVDKDPSKKEVAFTSTNLSKQLS